MGVLVLAGTPKEIITLLNREIVTIISLPDMRERLVTLGYDPVAGTPEEFAQRIKVEIGTWGKVIRAANIKAEEVRTEIKALVEECRTALRDSADEND